MAPSAAGAAARSPGAGFSLVELLVVLAIMAVLMGMVLTTTLVRDRTDAQVRGAAESLAAVLRETRTRAMHEKAAYGVVFHIQNQPGTSGVVLNNWSSGHWYRVIGPHAQGGAFNSRALPHANYALMSNNMPIQGNFPEHLAKIADSWVSQPYVLPSRQVRFLALSDLEEGPRRTRSPRSTGAGGIDIYYGDAGETTYPRPWFGYFDPLTRKWWPWGGYTPGKKYSGFFYEGSGGPIGDSRNPDTRAFDHNFYRGWIVEGGSNRYVDNVFQNVDLDGDGTFDGLREREVAFPLWTINEPRPLVNADWMDACIQFNPLGQASFLEWNRGRRMFAPVQATVRASGDADTAAYGKNGCSDRAKICIDAETDSYPGIRDKKHGLTGTDYVREDGNAEVVHFERHNGGYHITLAPDAMVDGNDFESAASVLRSITPAYRIFVGSSGTVRVIRVQRRTDSILEGKAVWPTTPDAWTQTAAGNPVFRRCRLGWLHEDKATTGYVLQKTGRPINYLISERMLSDRIWWFDE